MVTYFLSIDEVRAYLLDFLIRFQRLDPMPTIWCPITRSGKNLLRQIDILMKEYYPELAKKISVVYVEAKQNSPVRFVTENPREDINQKGVLLFDSAVHTGRMISECVAEAIKLGASHVSTYSLMVKRGSRFIPTFWGIMINDTDRIYFLLDEIPNLRLDAGPNKKDGIPKKIHCVHIQRLCESLLKKTAIECGVDALDRVTWGDRHFDMVAGGHDECTYVLQMGDEIVGYLTLHLSEPRCLVITEIAVDKKQQGKNFGGILLRFADSLARQSNCVWVRLNAIENKIGYYEDFDYKTIPGRDPIQLDDIKYFPMEHKVIYHPLPFSE
jgi:GNAT superfamily N-acetyltransferase